MESLCTWYSGHTREDFKDLGLNQEIKEVSSGVESWISENSLMVLQKNLRKKSIPDKGNKIYKVWDEFKQRVFRVHSVLG